MTHFESQKYPFLLQENVNLSYLFLKCIPHWDISTTLYSMCIDWPSTSLYNPDFENLLILPTLLSKTTHILLPKIYSHIKVHFNQVRAFLTLSITFILKICSLKLRAYKPNIICAFHIPSRWVYTCRVQIWAKFG